VGPIRNPFSLRTSEIEHHDISFYLNMDASKPDSEHIEVQPNATELSHADATPPVDTAKSTKSERAIVWKLDVSDSFAYSLSAEVADRR